MSDLNPCPKCGAKARIIDAYGKSGYKASVVIRCSKSRGHGAVNELNERDAIAAWNRRFPEEAK